MGWANSTFSKADDPADAGWMIMYWRITKCKGCKSDYSLEARQFDHLPNTATQAEAQEWFNGYVDQKILSGEQESIKGLTLFLVKVDTMTIISDKSGKIKAR